MSSNLLFENYQDNIFGKIKYFFHHYDSPLINLIKNQNNDNIYKGFVKNIGRSDDETIKEKVRYYKEHNLPRYKFSSERYKSLGATIDVLKVLEMYF